MTKTSNAVTGLPDSVRRSISELGRGLRLARTRRRIPQSLMAERMFVSRQTLQRLEAGDPTVGLAVLASALFVLGLSRRLESLVAPETDALALEADLGRLPRATRRPLEYQRSVSKPKSFSSWRYQWDWAPAVRASEAAQAARILFKRSPSSGTPCHKPSRSRRSPDRRRETSCGCV